MKHISKLVICSHLTAFLFLLFGNTKFSRSISQDSFYFSFVTISVTSVMYLYSLSAQSPNKRKIDEEEKLDISNSCELCSQSSDSHIFYCIFIQNCITKTNVISFYEFIISEIAFCLLLLLESFYSNTVLGYMFAIVSLVAMIQSLILFIQLTYIMSTNQIVTNVTTSPFLTLHYKPGESFGFYGNWKKFILSNDGKSDLL